MVMGTGAFIVRTVHFASLGMAMAPEQQFLEHEEHEDSAEDGRRRLARVAALERVRNHFEERRSEQRSDREGNQCGYPARSQEQRERREPGGKRSADEAGGEDPAERRRHGAGDSTRTTIERSREPYIRGHAA